MRIRTLALSVLLGAAPALLGAAPAHAKRAGKASKSKIAKLDLNSCNAVELAQATGLPEEIAQRIVVGGPYVSKHEIVKKKFVDEKTFDRISPMLTVKKAKK